MTATVWLERLGDGDRHVRDEAFEHLADSTDPTLLPLLMKQVSTADPLVEALLCRYLQHQDFALALAPLRAMLQSPNAATRRHACTTVRSFAVEQCLELLVELLQSPRVDVICFALEELGKHRRSVAIGPIAALLDSDDLVIVEAALSALSHIDHPRATRKVMPVLKHADAGRRVMALETLGTTNHFKRWRHLARLLDDGDAAVRLAAVRNASRIGLHRVHSRLLRLLERESDAEITKLILSRLALAPDVSIALALVPMAATHEDPQIRRAAGWVVEEFDEAVLLAAFDELLRDAQDEVRAYVLVKMGMREMAGAGQRLAAQLTAGGSPRLLYAAIEGLGFLREPRWLDRVVPFIDSDDPMAAYVATLTTAQLVDNLSACPPLVALLRAPDEQRVALKQVVLQFMIDSVTWTFDEALYEQLLLLLQSSNENVSYLAAILLGRGRGRSNLVQPLLKAALYHEHAEVAAAAREGLDGVLAGDLAPVLDELAREPRVLELLPHLQWDAPSVDRGLIPVDHAIAEAEPCTQALRQLAEALVQGDAPRVRLALQGDELCAAWRRALGQASLDALGDLMAPAAQVHWRELLQSTDDVLVAAACARALDYQPEWAAPALLQRAACAGVGDTASRLRAAARELLRL